MDETERLKQALDLLGPAPDIDGEIPRCYLVRSLMNRKLDDYVNEKVELDRHGNLSGACLLSLRQILQSVINPAWGIHVHLANNFNRGELSIAIRPLSELNMIFDRIPPHSYTRCLSCDIVNTVREGSISRSGHRLDKPTDLVCDCGSIREVYQTESGVSLA